MDKILNPDTGRYVKKDGKIGRKIQLCIQETTSAILHQKNWFCLSELFHTDIFRYIILEFCDTEDIENMVFLSKTLYNSIIKYSSFLYKKTYKSVASPKETLYWLIHNDRKITKTIAKTKYKLTDEILSKLDYEEKYFYSYNVYGKLFLAKDVLHQAIVLHESLHKLKIKLEEKKAKSIIFAQKKKEKYETRKKELTDALSQFKLKIRADSRLCQLYIDGKENNLKYVVNRMCQMKYLFEYIPIQKYINEIHDSMWNNEYDENDYDEDEPMHETVERLYSIKYPTEWPWMKK